MSGMTGEEKDCSIKQEQSVRMICLKCSNQDDQVCQKTRSEQNDEVCKREKGVKVR